MLWAGCSGEGRRKLELLRLMIGSFRLEIRPGREDDQPKAWALLADAGLPTADLPAARDLRFWVGEADGALQGVIALERFGVEGLLRSLAVTPR